MTTPHVVLTDRYAQAVQYAATVHGAQTRKGNDIAYMAHLLGVSSLVIEARGDEDQAIAGLLHDAVEDAGGMPRLADVRARFGDRVAEMVLGCSDSTDAEVKRSMDYWERKREYLEHLAVAPAEVVLVSIADKVHNARAILTDLQLHGPGVLAKFNGTPDQILRYYRECLRIATSLDISPALTTPLETALTGIAVYVDEST